MRLFPKVTRRFLAVLIGAGMLLLAPATYAKPEGPNPHANPNAPGQIKKGISVPELGLGAAGAGLVVAAGVLLVMSSRRRKRSA